MAIGILGGVGQYDHVKETFVSYTERLENCFSCEQYRGSGRELGRTNSCSKRRERKKKKKRYFSVKSVLKFTW